MRGLDDTDLKILRLLQSNPRTPVSKLARAVGLTDNAIRYRVKRLQASSIIRGFVTVVDPQLLGRPALGLLLLKLRDPEDLPRLLHKHAHAGADSVRCLPGGYRTNGRFNAFLFACATSEEELRRFAHELPRHVSIDEWELLSVEEAFGGSPTPLVPDLPGLPRRRR